MTKQMQSIDKFLLIYVFYNYKIWKKTWHSIFNKFDNSNVKKIKKKDYFF